MWATLALERSASSRRSAEALDETAGWSAAGRSRRVGGGRAVRPREPPRPARARRVPDSAGVHSRRDVDPVGRAYQTRNLSTARRTTA